MELSEYYQQDRTEELATLEMDGDWLILRGHYEIDTRQIQTAADLLAWVTHLSGKTWVTPTLLRRFTETAAAMRSIPLRDVTDSDQTTPEL